MKKIKILLFIMIVLGIAGTVSADWDAPKWAQMPDLTQYGMDVRIDRADSLYDRGIADDFLCMDNEEPITDIHFWGSWKNDIKGNITKIHAAIYTDIPAEPGITEYSRPGDKVKSWVFEQDSFTERHYANIAPSYERWYDPYTQEYLREGDQNVWQYNIDIDQSEFFWQQGTPENPIVYWLEIWVETDGTGEFGWKTSVQHWNDDAVYKFSDESPDWAELTYPYDTPIWQGNSADMAFVITTPEPTTIALLGIGGLIVGLNRRKRIS